MKLTKFKIMGKEVEKQLPNSLAELKAMGLDEAAVVQTAVNQIRHHVFAGDVRETVAEALEERTGVKRPEVETGAFSKASVALTRPVAAEKYIEELVNKGKCMRSDVDRYIVDAVAKLEFAASSPREAKAKISAEDVVAGQKADAYLAEPAKLSKFKALFEEAGMDPESIDWTTREGIMSAWKSWSTAI